MLFSFLKYLQPTHYFQLYRKDGSSIFPISSKLPAEVLSQLERDNSFTMVEATNYDLAWQATFLGYIGTEETYEKFEKLAIIDEYRFIKKYFHPVWTYYVCFLRIFLLKNPIQEIRGLWKTRRVHRVNLKGKQIRYNSYTSFKSTKLAEQPLISVVIPTLNRYEHLKAVLKDFEQQTYKNFELIIIDQSSPFQADFYKQFNLNIHVKNQKESALWLARNTAIKLSNGEYIALSEDDVRIENNWLEEHLKCLDYFKASISAGVFFPEGFSIPENRSFFAIAQQFATGNALLKKDVFRTIGLFDRQFERQRMGDGEFGLRAYLNGFKSVSNPNAFCIDVKAETGGLREMGSWDAFRPTNWFAPRPVPSVLYLFRRYYGASRTLLSLIKTVPPSIMPYRFKRNKKIMLLGAVVSAIILPIILLQVIRSWYLASKKIKKGALIGTLET